VVRRCCTVLLKLFHFGLRPFSLQVTSVGRKFPVFSDNSVIIHQQVSRPCTVELGPSPTDTWSHTDRATDEQHLHGRVEHRSRFVNGHSTSHQDQSDKATNAPVMPSCLYSTSAPPRLIIRIHSSSVHSCTHLGQEKELLAVRYGHWPCRSSGG
jgi:hypothetical protein